jgi:hypothetical protein
MDVFFVRVTLSQGGGWIIWSSTEAVTIPATSMLPTTASKTKSVATSRRTPMASHCLALDEEGKARKP